jgi:choline dehydrogenase-like flavoprotein
VIEYGDLADSWNLSIPYYATALQDASLMFATPSVPQRGLGGRIFNLPLGATVGGGSTVNGMAYLRGARVDYDTWESIGNRGWGWREMFKYFKKVHFRRPNLHAQPTDIGAPVQHVERAQSRSCQAAQAQLHL